MKLATGCGLMLTVACEVPAQPSAVSASRVTVAVINPVEALNQVWVGVASLDVVPSPKFHVKFCAPAISGMVNSKGEHTESALKFNAYSAAANTSTVAVATSAHPKGCVAVKVTSNAVLLSIPSKVWLTYEPLTLVPSPKFQLKSVPAVLVLVKAASNGSQPLKASALKAAVGWGFTVIKSTAKPAHPCSVSPVTLTM